ncbi:MAG TPA: hypothetical protein VMU78_02385 [Methylocella sp.]|nr:hypothetical protein [Methylocella sp.]
MSRKVSMACAGVFAAVASLAGISPALSHTIVGNRVFPATLDVDDPGVNDEFTAPLFSYVPNPDNSNAYGFGFEWQKTITADLSFAIGDTFTHLTHTVKPDGTIGTLNGWDDIETQLKYQLFVNPEHEFIVSVAGSVAWGHTGDVGAGFADPYSSITAKAYVGKGFGDLNVDWLRPIAVTGEMDYTWSTHPIDVAVDPDTLFPVISQTPTVLTYGATIQYSLLYMNSYVHEVPQFFRQLVPDIECVFSTPVSNIGPSVAASIPGTHETTGTWGPGLYYFGRLGPLVFELGAVTQIPINRASGRHVGALAILDFFFDDMFPDSLGKPLFGPPQARSAKMTY